MASRLLEVSRRRERTTGFLASLALVVVLLSISAAKLDHREIINDARDNAVSSFNLRRYGNVASEDLSLSYTREPLPIAINAAFMAVATDIPVSTSYDELTSSPRWTRQLLAVNLVYCTGLLLALWWLSWLLTQSHLVACAAILGSWASLVMFSGYLDRLYTEIAAGFLITLAAATAVWLFRSKTIASAALFGAALGLLALTKASILFVAILTIPILALALTAFRLASVRRAGVICACTTLSFAIVVTPWMLRNKYYFGEFAIAQRGGGVLLARAVKNGMTPEEFRGAFYVYAPPAIRPLFERLLGFNAVDLEANGRYARLIRDQPGDEEAIEKGDVGSAVSYYAKARAMRTAWRKEIEASGGSAREVDVRARAAAVTMIKQNPWAHMRATALFAWRGLWLSGGRQANIIMASVNPICLLVLLAFPVLAVLKGRPEWLAFSLVGVGLFGFYAVATHFLPRYSAPLVPLGVLASIVLVRSIWRGELRQRPQSA